MISFLYGGLYVGSIILLVSRYVVSTSLGGILIAFLLFHIFNHFCHKVYPFKWYKQLPDKEKSYFSSSYRSLSFIHFYLPNFIGALLWQ